MSKSVRLTHRVLITFNPSVRYKKAMLCRIRGGTMVPGVVIGSGQSEVARLKEPCERHEAIGDRVDESAIKTRGDSELLTSRGEIGLERVCRCARAREKSGRNTAVP